MIAQYFNEYTALGLKVIPIEWDTVKKQPVSHTEWSKDIKYKVLPHHNGIMIKTAGEYACIDFDHKNASRQTIYQEWLEILLNQRPELYEKFYVEKTRNDGYHVWINYHNLTGKQSLADSGSGMEVIALYAGTPLVYTAPTPGYTEVHASMADVQPLTDEEYEYLIGLSQFFNEYHPTYDPNKKAVSYPAGYEKFLGTFDNTLTSETWNQMLTDIGLLPIPNYKYNKKQYFAAYRRKGSVSDSISAKVYFKSKRVCIFSASMHDYPNWHNKHDYATWSLPPSFLLFYKLGRDWSRVIEEIGMISDAAGIELPELPVPTGFPLNVFPPTIAEAIQGVCDARSLSTDFVAVSALWTISSLAGTRYHSAFNSEGKNILFCIMVAPVSVGKTPAFKVTCEQPLQNCYNTIDKAYDRDLEIWNEKKAAAASKKKLFTEPRPARYIPISKDGTTEGYIQKSMTQRNGIGVYQDEAETILNAGAFKQNNDATSFFTQAFSGGRVSQIRADESKERVVPNLNLNLLMGTQPDRLRNIFTEDKIASGFASRFIMLESGYIQLNTDSDPFGDKKEMGPEWTEIVEYLFWEGKNFNSGDAQVYEIPMDPDAADQYRIYYRRLLTEANTRMDSKIERYIIGTEAKMSAYLPRLIQILSILYAPKSPRITIELVHKGWTLYRYFADSTINILAKLHGEIETGLPAELELLFQNLPDEFSRAEAATTCTRINLNERRFDRSIRRKDFSGLFTKVAQGQYRKR